MHVTAGTGLVVAVQFVIAGTHTDPVSDVTFKLKFLAHISAQEARAIRLKMAAVTTRDVRTLINVTVRGTRVGLLEAAFLDVVPHQARVTGTPVN